MILDTIEKMQFEANRICMSSDAEARYTLPDEILEQIPQQFRLHYSKMDPFTCCITLNLLTYYFRSMYEMIASDVEMVLTREKLNALMDDDIRMLFTQND